MLPKQVTFEIAYPETIARKLHFLRLSCEKYKKYRHYLQKYFSKLLQFLFSNTTMHTNANKSLKINMKKYITR